MDRALFAAATGMAAQQQNLDAIADDLANTDVAGFKGSAQSFAELVAPGEGGIGTVGLGSHPLLTQGQLTRSGGPFDLAIDGPGFFSVIDEHGHRGFTRSGTFSRAADGTMRDAQDRRLEGFRVPETALAVSVAEDGTVNATFASGSRAIGKIRIAEFAAPDRLRATGGALFEATAESGPPRSLAAGAENGPKLRFGMLERSNVTIVESMMRILAAQRALRRNASVLVIAQACRITTSSCIKTQRRSSSSAI
jgi:flagellar basal-body rod protein FlgG